MKRHMPVYIITSKNALVCLSEIISENTKASPHFHFGFEQLAVTMAHCVITLF